MATDPRILALIDGLIGKKPPMAPADATDRPNAPESGVGDAFGSLLSMLNRMDTKVGRDLAARMPAGTTLRQGAVPSYIGGPKAGVLGEGTKRLFRVEANALGDKGEWLKPHMTPEQWKTFISERGRYYADEPMEQFGHGVEGKTTYYVDVPADVAEKARRMNPEGYPEYVVPPEWTGLRKMLSPKKP